MSETMSKRRLAENEVIFRQANQKVAKGFKKLKEVANEDMTKEWLHRLDEPVPFFCECSDEKCHKRIKLKPSEYDRLHQNNSQFVLYPGHNIASLERIVRSEDQYIVVEKFITPPETVTKLNKTNLDHNRTR